MSLHSNVEWCDSAANPVAGCDGCELWIPNKGIRHCYAGVMTERYAGRAGWPASFTEPKMFPGRMAQAARWSDLRGRLRPDKPWLNGMPRVIFVEDMGDALSRSVPFRFLQTDIESVCSSVLGRRHLYLWLTKQPHRVVEFDAWLEKHGIDWPRNLGIGTSIIGARVVHRARHLFHTRAPLLFLSVEPVIEHIDDHDFMETLSSNHRKIGWVATGGESGLGARPYNAKDLRSVVKQCQDATVRVFVKQLGARIHWGEQDPMPWPALRDRRGGDPSEWPEDLRGPHGYGLRQMPDWSWTPGEGAAWLSA